MKRTTRILTLVLMGAAMAAAGYAQQGSKIGVVNSQDVLEKSAEGKKVIARLQDKDRQTQAALTKLDDEIRQIETRLNTQRLTLTDEAVIQMTSDLDKKRTDRKRVSEDSTRELQELQYRMFNKVQGELLSIIEAIGRERNLDIVLDLAKSGAVYFSPAINVTDEVIRRYDASKAAAPAK
jgi:Skp family chaperone for outer membrane proteins